jgi:GT2 family glycosyltransferase
MDISVIILICNSAMFIQACLDSLCKQLDENVEVILVDNGSTDGSADIVKKKYKRVVLIENKNNFGASHARNQAITHSKGKWVLTLDSDVILAGSFICNFREFQAKLPDTVGMVHTNILTYNGKKIYSQGIYLSTLKRFYNYNMNKKSVFICDQPKKLIGPCSAAAFYKRSMLDHVKEKTGYFDENFFFLVEDVDLAWRCRRAGWGSMFCPQAICYHKGNSFKINKKVRQYLSYRNRKLMIKKHIRGIDNFNLYLLSGFYELIRCIYLYMYNPYFRAKSRPLDIINIKS